MESYTFHLDATTSTAFTVVLSPSGVNRRLVPLTLFSTEPAFGLIDERA